MGLISYAEMRADTLAGMKAACRHVGFLWPQRHHPLVRRWIREYIFTVRMARDQLGLQQMRPPFLEVVEP